MFGIIIALAGLDFSAIRVPSSGSSGSLSSSLQGNDGTLSSPISIGMNDDPAMVRETFFKNPDQLALVSNLKLTPIKENLSTEFMYSYT